MNVNVHFHIGTDTDALKRAMKKGFKNIMGVLDDMKAILSEANEALDEIALDIDDLMGRLEGGLTGDEAAELSGDLGAIRDRLRGVAAEWPVVAPPVEGEPEA